MTLPSRQRRLPSPPAQPATSPCRPVAPGDATARIDAAKPVGAAAAKPNPHRRCPRRGLAAVSPRRHRLRLRRLRSPLPRPAMVPGLHPTGPPTRPRRHLRALRRTAHPATSSPTARSSPEAHRPKDNNQAVDKQESIRGTQYMSEDFATAAQKYGLRRSVGRTGICYDNAQAETFNAAVKVERVNRTQYPTREHARKDVTRYIEFRYNRRRLHSDSATVPRRRPTRTTSNQARPRNCH